MKTVLISRRSFLSVVGAVGAAAALTACGGCFQHCLFRSCFL